RSNHAHLLPAINALRPSRNSNRYEDPSLVTVKTGHLARPFWLNLEKALDPIFRRQFYPALNPVDKLERLAGHTQWQSTGQDPQFVIDGDVPVGWVRLLIEIDAPGGLEAASRLYLDSGTGFSEALSHDLGKVGRPRSYYVELGPDVRRIRLDPIDRPGPFTVKKFVLRRVTGLEADLWDRRRRSRLQALRRAQANRASLDRIDLPPAVEP